MAHVLADDPSKAAFSVAGLLLMDSPHHVARSRLAGTTSKVRDRPVPHLVKTALENCDAMLQHWELPSWDAPAPGTRFTVDGRNFALCPGSVLYKAVGGAWGPVDARPWQPAAAAPAAAAAAPPPGVLIRCTRRAETHEGQGSAPCLVDVHRDATLLGWEGSHADFIKAVMDVDADHYALFDVGDEAKAGLAPRLSWGRWLTCADEAADGAGQCRPRYSR